MAHAENHGLGQVLQAEKPEVGAKLQLRFVFAVDVPVSTDHPEYGDWHNKLMTLCRTSAEEYTAKRLLLEAEDPQTPRQDHAPDSEEEAAQRQQGLKRGPGGSPDEKSPEKRRDSLALRCPLISFCAV